MHLMSRPSHPGCQKNTLIDKKCADYSVSRRASAGRRPAACRGFLFYGALTNCLLRPYAKRRQLKAMGLPEGRNGGRKEEELMTVELHEKSLWLIPVGLAIFFMLWALWNWWREERRQKHSSSARLTFPDRPAPSSSVRDGRRIGIAVRH